MIDGFNGLAILIERSLYLRAGVVLPFSTGLCNGVLPTAVFFMDLCLVSQLFVRFIRGFLSPLALSPRSEIIVCCVPFPAGFHFAFCLYVAPV